MCMQKEEAEQAYREAALNGRLADAWACGERWAAMDYNGLPLDGSRASCHQAAREQVPCMLLKIHQKTRNLAE